MYRSDRTAAVKDDDNPSRRCTGACETAGGLTSVYEVRLEASLLRRRFLTTWPHGAGAGAASDAAALCPQSVRLLGFYATGPGTHTLATGGSSGRV